MYHASYSYQYSPYTRLWKASATDRKTDKFGREWTTINEIFVTGYDEAEAKINAAKVLRIRKTSDVYVYQVTSPTGFVWPEVVVKNDDGKEVEA